MFVLPTCNKKKNKEKVFVGPQINKLIDDEDFLHVLHDKEKAA